MTKSIEVLNILGKKIVIFSSFPSCRLMPCPSMGQFEVLNGYTNTYFLTAVFLETRASFKKNCC